MTEIGERFEARHFDGAVPEPRAAVVWPSADGLWLEVSPDPPRRWAFDELVVIRGANGREPVQLERRSDPVEVVIVNNPAFFTRLRDVMPKTARLAHDGGKLPAFKLVAIFALLGAGLLFAIYRFGIPALADFAADRIPAEWERRWGEQLRHDVERTSEVASSEVLLRPARLAGASLEPMAEPQWWTIVKENEPNAFTLPGRTIVLTTGLLRALDSPDELAAVIAHEIGHERRRHSVRMVLRQLSLQALLGLVAGDQSTLSRGLRTAGDLGALSYSREYEREADDEAIALLASHGASPLALADALHSIGRERDGYGPPVGFLSTHPAPAERFERIRNAAEAATVQGANGWRDSVAWSAMKAAAGTSSP
jgi:beta-barrel assembly-enhancing protease